MQRQLVIRYVLLLLCVVSFMMLSVWVSLQAKTSMIKKSKFSEFSDLELEFDAEKNLNDDDGSSGFCLDSKSANKAISSMDNLKSYVQYCENRNSTGNGKVMSECKFCQQKKPKFLHKHKPFVALASFPGSGNSWTRELLEYITGVYTGSIYTDNAGNFAGSKKCPTRGNTYIIKTHRHDYATDHPDCKKLGAKKIIYDKAMYILRNPYNAMMSTFNLLAVKSKVGLAKKADFLSTRWEKYVSTIKIWKVMTQYWLTRSNIPVHVIVYNELTKNTTKALYKISNFLGLNTTYMDLYCAKYCLKPKYHRVNKPDWMTSSYLYDEKLKQMVNTVIRQVIDILGTTEYKSIIPELETYIME